jgi:hypothetical protein
MELDQELDEVDIERRQPVSQLYDIEPALTALHLADQALVAAE